MHVNETLQQVGNRFGQVYSFDPTVILIALKVFLILIEECGDKTPEELRSVPAFVMRRRIRLRTRMMTTHDQWREFGDDLSEAMLDYVQSPDNATEFVTAVSAAKSQA